MCDAILTEEQGVTDCYSPSPDYSLEEIKELWGN